MTPPSAVLPFTASRPCARCDKRTTAELYRIIRPNGISHVFWRCMECEGPVFCPGGGMWINHSLLIERGVDIEDIPIARIEQTGARCRRCGERGAELHHWAPRGIFGDDADNWPQDYLCRSCHQEWHAKVTPGLVAMRPARANGTNGSRAG